MANRANSLEILNLEGDRQKYELKIINISPNPYIQSLHNQILTYFYY